MQPLPDSTPNLMTEFFTNNQVYNELSENELIDLLCQILNEDAASLKDLAYAFAPTVISDATPTAAYQAINISEVLEDIESLRNLVCKASALELSSKVNIAKINTKTGELFSDVVKPQNQALKNLMQDFNIDETNVVKRSDEERLLALEAIKEKSKVMDFVELLDDVEDLEDLEEENSTKESNEAALETKKAPKSDKSSIKAKIISQNTPTNSTDEINEANVNINALLAKSILNNQVIQKERINNARKEKRLANKKLQQKITDERKIEDQDKRLEAAEDAKKEIQENLDIGEQDKNIIDEKIDESENNN